MAILGPAAVEVGAAELARHEGRTLTEALLDLRSRGLDLAFTSHVVTPELRVTEEPPPGSPLEILATLLAPHGLTTEAAPNGGLVVVRAGPGRIEGLAVDLDRGVPIPGVEVRLGGTRIEAVSDRAGRFSFAAVAPGSYRLDARRPGYVLGTAVEVVVVGGQSSTVRLDLVAAAVTLDEIVVTPSAISLLRADPVSALAFDRDEIAELPHLGDDLFRALTLLPGASGDELSAQVHVHGGRADEVLVLLDQLELISPFHLQDFSNALSIVAPRAVAEMDILLGGFPAQFGDRMGAVLDMRTVTPDVGRRTHLGFSLLSTHASTAVRTPGDRWNGFGVARLGSLVLLSSYLTDEEQPRYWDAFGKLERSFGDRHRLGLRVLGATDRLDFRIQEPNNGDIEDIRTAYDTAYVWLTHHALISDDLYVDTVVSRIGIDRDRRATELEPDGEGFDIVDRRALIVAAVKQDWGLQPDEANVVRWGFEARRLDADYDYRSERELDDPFGPFRSEPRSGVTTFDERLRGDQYAAYATDRIRLHANLTAELGVRFDEHETTRDRDVSPRVNLVLALGKNRLLRAGWGLFFQGQRLYELQVEDRETRLRSAERTEHAVVGFEQIFAGGTTLRLGVYHRDIRNPRLRYENAFEPISSFPEIEPDRVRVQPDRGRAFGAELFLRGKAGSRVDWWLSYAYARAQDEIDGRTVARGIDQPHTLNVDLAWRATRAWSLNFAWRYHTGWPTTAISAVLEEDDEGEVEPVLVLGPLYGERLSDYHRLDVRASRQWTTRRGAWTFFVDLQNVYDRENIAGVNVEVDFAIRPDGTVEVIEVEETWGGRLLSLGFEWAF